MAIRAEDLHRFTVNQYLQMHENDPSLDRTELCEGVILDMSPESWLHAQTVKLIDDQLNTVFPNRSFRNGSVRLSSMSLWEPDVYVLRPHVTIADYPTAADLELVVEVALSTVTYDTTVKSRTYADAGIPRYWVVRPTEPGWIVLHANPLNGRYVTDTRVELPAGFEEFDVRPWA